MKNSLLKIVYTSNYDYNHVSFYDDIRDIFEGKDIEKFICYLDIIPFSCMMRYKQNKDIRLKILTTKFLVLDDWAGEYHPWTHLVFATTIEFRKNNKLGTMIITRSSDWKKSPLFEELTLTDDDFLSLTDPIEIRSFVRKFIKENM